MSQALPTKLDPRREPVFPRAIMHANRHGYPMLASLLVERESVGIATYGESLHSHNGRDVLKDALEEVADAYVYLEQALCEVKPAKEWELLSRAQNQVGEVARLLFIAVNGRKRGAR